MLRVYVVVEGQTESSFVENVLAEYFWNFDILLTAPIIGVPGHKGGRCNYARLKRDVLRLLRQESESRCTTLVDYYGLGGGFPGERTSGKSSQDRAGQIEQSMAADVEESLPEGRVGLRFLPYIQVHEFEALLFSDTAALAETMRVPEPALRVIRERFASPEDINDSPETAPSKRILTACPGYRKVLHGERAARSAGVESMREQCPRFRGWTDRIASWGAKS